MSTPSKTPSPSLTSSPDSSSHSSTALALGISLAAVAVLLFGGLVFYFVRRHQKRGRTRARNEELSSHRRTYMVSVDPTHLAARVTPFGVNAPDVQVPKFVHNPGSNMRVAYRRSDGGWTFQEPERTSQSVDLQHEATYSTLRFNQKEKQLRPGELTTRGYVESDIEGIPPPAYSHEGSVLSDSTGV